MSPGEGAKILFTGPTGAGKSTAIRALSDLVAPSADDARGNPFDYGEFRREGKAPLRLYGAPAQLRFDFMWKVLADEAIGLVVLLDHPRPDPASDALRYVQSFDALARRGACVVAVGRFDGMRAPRLQAIASRLQTAGYRVPVLEIDVRRKTDMLLVMQTLLALAQPDAVTEPESAPRLLSNQ